MSKCNRPMPDGRHTAFHTGQEDYLKGHLPHPAAHMLTDAYRVALYMDGYQREARDHSLVVATLVREGM